MLSSVTGFGITFHLYGLIIGIAVACAYTLSQKVAGKLYPHGEIVRRDIDESIWWLIGGGLIGARLYHIADYWWYYARHLGEIMAVWRGGLGIYGGIAGGLIGAIIWDRHRGKILNLIDAVAICLPLAQALGRWGNYVNQELYGYPTNLPWGIYIDSTHRLSGFENMAYYHPLFLYEMVWNIVGFGILWRLVTLQRLVTGKGNYVVLYLFWYALGRTILEPFKLSLLTSSKTMAISVGMIIMILTVGIYIYRRVRHEWTVLVD